ncbi:MAG TPA: PhoPQ-activated protein PqaA family protein [Gammaproteobacteria bacterium]|nr:PhoPQ-activated protein PqaA family protein [Gammaproteobacteria bacterium]
MHQRRPRTPRLAWLATLALVCAGGAHGQGPPAPSAALATYVHAPDPTYSWRIQRRYTNPNAEILELHLESQTWKGGLWQHQLMLVRPKRVPDPRHAVLVVGGGRWHDEFATATAEEPLPKDGELFVAIARALRSTVVVLGQVPFQPLFDLTEDKLIAHTFDRYLATGDTEWPLLLPMVKAVVRAMDASSEASLREWGAPLERFTVTGGSKRGWTTWLTAPVDSRVTAIAPIVIDALNMRRHFPHQTQVWGAPSEAIRPYTDLHLTDILGSDAGEPLRQIVDPYSYRAALTLPKLIVLATNDEYFPLDSANLYWDGLPGPKYLLYMPNEPHGIEHFGPFVRGLRALHAAADRGPPLPKLDWEYQWQDSQLVLCVRSAQPGAGMLKLWQASSSDRDFRDEKWATVAQTKGAAARFVLPRPAAGYAAAFVEAGFGRALKAFALSTNLAVFPAAGERDYGTRPGGVPGVCAAVAKAPELRAGQGS